MKRAFDPDRIAALSRLELSEEERPALLRDMETLVSFADRLTVDVREPNEPPPAVGLRADVPAPCTPREELLRGSATHTEQYFTVPKSFSEEESV